MFPVIVAALVLQNPSVVNLGALDLSGMSSGWRTANKDRSVDGHALTIGGRVFAHGVGTHSVSSFVIRLHRNALSFHSWVGVDDETDKRGSVDFQVFVGGVKKADSGVMRGGDAAREVTADLTGADRVNLVVDDGGDGIDYDHADWADAQFTVKDPAVALEPVSVVKEPTMEISHVDLTKTEICGARVTGCTPGHEFLFRIPATGRQPLSYSVSGLPDGISLASGTPVLRGTAPAEGTYKVRITVSGPGGKATRDLTIVSGDHKLALTPPMGWNSWNVWGTTVNAERVRAAADQFISSHLADFGYTYVNIDDAWEGSRDPEGIIVPNRKFGDMAALARDVHDKGIKLGIYSSPGPKTCAGYEATYQHELQDARTYAEWGVDYLKYDWCSYQNVPHPAGLPGFQLPYKVMRDALDQAPRDIVFSLCQYGMGDVYKWGHSEVGGNLWRTTGDINDSWSSMSGIGFSHSIRSPYVKPGGWNDPDMLVVGRLGWGDNPHPTHLTGNEQITHISLWSMLAAPLIIGCDLTRLDQFTKDVLMNPEVLDVDQDPKGSAATRRFKDGDLEVWARPLWDGSYAVGLFNRGIEEAPIHTDWARDLGLKGPFKVRALWQRKNVGTHRDGFTAKVHAHGAYLIRVTKT